MPHATQGQLVQIHVVVLEPGSRPAGLPEATRAVPYEGWIKGFLIDPEAALGDEVKITTMIGREMTGRLVAVSPPYDHDFGRPRPELLTIGRELFVRIESFRGARRD